MPVNLKGDIVDNKGNIMTEVTSPTSSSSNDEFTKLLTNTLMNQSSIISSADTGLEDRLNKAIAGTQTAADKSGAVIESVYNREKASVAEKGAQTLATAQESQRGYAQNTAVLRQLESDTDKSIRDLEQRKQELIMTGDAAAASKIADLQFQAEQFRQTSRQQTFSNLLAMGGFQLQAKGQALQEKQQNFAEKSAIASIGLQYGIKVNEGDTMESIVSRAAPFASAKQQAELAKLMAETKRANAETQKAMQGMDFTMDSATITTLAKTLDDALRSGDQTRIAVAQTTLNNVIEKHGAVASGKIDAEISRLRSEEFSPTNLTIGINDDYKSGATYGTIYDGIQAKLQTGIMSPKQAEEATVIAKKLEPKVQSNFLSFTNTIKSLMGERQVTPDGRMINK